MSHFCFLHLKLFSCSNLASSEVLFTVGSVGHCEGTSPVTEFSEFTLDIVPSLKESK